MAKICIQCGGDCTETKRFKDAKGNYTCLRCYDRMKYGLPIEREGAADQGEPIALADEAPARGDRMNCPRCKHLMGPGETVCTECRYDLSIEAAPRVPDMEVSRPCPKCGYDLRGLDERRACPECGADVYEREHVKRERKKTDSVPSFYTPPLIIAACGLVALVLLRLINGDGSKLVADVLAIGVSVPLAVAAYWLFSIIWAGGFDQAWGLAAVNFLAVFAVSWTVDTFFRYVPVPFFGWFISLAVYYGMLKERLDLDGWADAFILTLILRAIQIVTLLGVVALLK